MSHDVKLVEVTKEKARNGKDDLLVVSYEHTSGRFAGQVWSMRALAKALSAESRSILLNKSNLGHTISIDKEPYQYTNASGEEKTGYNLKSVSLPGVMPAAVPSTGGTFINKPTSVASTAKGYDDTGVKVGASRNQAIAFLAATKGAKFTLDDVDTTALEIVKRQASQEEIVRHGVSPSKDQEDHKQDLDESITDLIGVDDDPDF